MDILSYMIGKMSSGSGGSGGGGTGGGGGEENNAERYIAEQVAEVVLPTAESIKPYAFNNDTLLTNIIMPKVKNIGASAFYSCSNLALTSLPNNLTTIGDYAFSGCTNLALTSLPNNLETIGNRSFPSCKNTFTSFPSSLKSIGERAFYYNSSLTSLTFKGTPTNIASNAFDGCSYITTINVPWAEGAVSGAPWGAAQATINYNYVGE